MRTYIDHPASAFPRLRGRQIASGIAALLLPVVIGCASTPKPVTIRHDRTPSQSEAAISRQQSQREFTDPVKQREAKQLEAAGSVPVQPAAMSNEVKSSAAAQDAPGPAASASDPAQPAAPVIAGTAAADVQESRPPQATPGPDPSAPAPAQPEAMSTAVSGTASAQESRAAQEERERELDDRITARVTEEVRKTVEEEVKRDVMNELYREVWKVNWALKEKEKRLKFGGDIRVRYEADRFDPNNALMAQPSNPTQLMNTQNDTSRFKYRVRFGAEAQVNEQTDAVIRISTGNTSNPVSTNATMGDYMNKDSVVFDLAYIRWRPWSVLTLYGGRMPNPFFSVYDMIWDTDVNFEGFAVKARKSAAESWGAFLNAGAFPLQQYDFSARNKWLLGGQAGLERSDKKGVSVRIGVAYYDYINITGVANDPSQPGETDWTAPPFIQKGNTLFNISSDPNALKLALAADYNELNVTGTVDIGYWDPVHIVLAGDYVKNIGFKKSGVMQRTGDPNQPEEITGRLIGISVGYPIIQEGKQWRVFFYNKRLEADAVLDAFTDSDFHLGGTNAKGWMLGAEVGMARNLSLTLRWLTANEISGPPLAIDVLQVDVNARF